MELKAISLDSQKGSVAGIVRHPTSEGDYDFSICSVILALGGFLNWACGIFWQMFFKVDPHSASALACHTPRLIWIDLSPVIFSAMVIVSRSQSQ